MVAKTEMEAQDDIEQIMKEIKDLQNTLSRDTIQKDGLIDESSGDVATASSTAESESATSFEVPEMGEMAEFSGSTEDAPLEDLAHLAADDHPPGSALNEFNAKLAEGAEAPAEHVERHDEAVERHDEVVEKHDEVVEKHDEVVASHDEALARHDEAEVNATAEPEAVPQAVTEVRAPVMSSRAIPSSPPIPSPAASASPVASPRYPEARPEMESAAVSQTRSGDSESDGTLSLTLTGNMRLKLHWQMGDQEVSVGFSDEYLRIELTDGTEFKVPLKKHRLRAA